MFVVLTLVRVRKPPCEVKDWTEVTRLSRLTTFICWAKPLHFFLGGGVERQVDSVNPGLAILAKPASKNLGSACPISPSTRITRATRSSFYIGVGDPNSGPYAWETPTQPLAQPRRTFDLQMLQLFLKAGWHYLAQANLTLMNLLPQSVEGWDWRLSAPMFSWLYVLLRKKPFPQPVIKRKSWTLLPLGCASESLLASRALSMKKVTGTCLQVPTKMTGSVCQINVQYPKHFILSKLELTFFILVSESSMKMWLVIFHRISTPKY